MTDLSADVAGLADELRNLAHTVDGVAGIVSTELVPLTQTVADLSQQVAAITGDVARLAQEPATPNDDRHGALTWLGYEGDTETAERILTHLNHWITDIYCRYTDITDHPGCWIYHPDMVEELLWLYNAWLHAYSARARPDDRGAWHDRQRLGVAHRITTSYARACRHDHHPQPPTPEAIRDVAQWWTTARHQPPPEPTGQQLETSHTTSRSNGRTSHQTTPAST